MPKEKLDFKKIHLHVGLDQNKLPQKIKWEAEETGDGPQEAKAFLLALFDRKRREALKIDMWTTDLEIREMDFLMYNTLRSLADTYFKATGNAELANDMHKFALYFGDKIGIPPDTEQNGG